MLLNDESAATVSVAPGARTFLPPVGKGVELCKPQRLDGGGLFTEEAPGRGGGVGGKVRQSKAR